MAKKARKKKRRSSSKSSGSKSSGSKSSGGVMMSMRGGFKRAAQSATGTGNKSGGKNTQTFWWIVTVILLAIAAYMALQRLGYL